MGIYLNPGKEAYQEALNTDIYVDKTEMIPYLNSVLLTKKKYISVSRPRRFGKTMAADIICAYYDRTADSRGIFEKRKLAACAPVRAGERELAWDAYLGKFDVIRLTMTDFMEDCDTVQDMLDYLTEELTAELMEAYPEVRFGNRKTVSAVMSKIYGKTKQPFVVVIDEWDAVFREWKDNEGHQKKYLDFLRNWMKDKPYIALAYMTGILPIKKYGKHSALNMFVEYSMMYPREMAPYTGFTEEEVQELCVRYGRNYEAIRDWYDGYDVSDVVPPDPGYEEQKSTGCAPKAKRYALYSPYSVVEAMTTGSIRNYWNKTETYEALAEYIRMDYDGLREAVALLMDGGRMKINPGTYQNDMTTFHGLEHYRGNILLVGINYQKELPAGHPEYRRHSCVIQKDEPSDKTRKHTCKTEWAISE